MPSKSQDSIAKIWRRSTFYANNLIMSLGVKQNSNKNNLTLEIKH